jgi:glucose-1-phosphate cytidylyltransferase
MISGEQGMRTVILCGGQGTRLQEATAGLIPKPMVEIGGRPILWHIMKGYAHHGFVDFVLCLGHLGNVIKEYFLHYSALNSDITLHLDRPEEIELHTRHSEVGWKVTLADTGINSMTGARVARIQRYIDEQTFMLTYGDGIADIDLKELVSFHQSHGKLATLTGVRPAGRFGQLTVSGNQVTNFMEKPRDGGRINGGFLVLEAKVFSYLSQEPGCTLEHEPLARLAAEGQLMMYPHDGFWQCMDTYRDLQLLKRLWQNGEAPWQLWQAENRSG